MQNLIEAARSGKRSEYSAIDVVAINWVRCEILTQRGGVRS